MIRLFSTPFSLRLAWCLVHFLWQGALLGLLAWGALATLRGQSSRIRYGLACAFLCLCALAPLLTFFLMAPSVTGSPGVYTPMISSVHTPMVLGLDSAQLQASLGYGATGALSWQARLVSWFPALLLGWMIGSLLLGLRMVGGWLWLQHLRRSAAPVLDGRWAKRVRELAAQAGIRRTVGLLQCARIRTPLAMGLLRPVILVPLGFFTQVDVVGAEAVLAHELAHLRRLDPLVNGLQCLLETLLFFHPAVHFISRRVRTERECCCDDDAVLACGDAVLYVETLCRLDALRERPLSLALSARGGNLMERIQRLLAPAPAPRFAMPVMTLALLSLGATALLAQAPKKAVPVSTPQAVFTSRPSVKAEPATPVPVAALDPWGDKGERTPVQIEAKTLKEAIRKFAELRNLDPVIGKEIQDHEGPFVFKHAPWRAALDNLVKSQGLICVIQEGVLRVAMPFELQNEAQWKSRFAPKAELPAPEARPAPEASTEPVKPTTIEYRTRSIEFTYWPAKEGDGKVRFVARNASREEVTEALRKIDLLAKSAKAGDQPIQGEWKLPSLKDEKGGEGMSFTYNMVTTQGIRELHR